jgi:predicted ATPase
VELLGCIVSLTDKSFLVTDRLGPDIVYRCLDVPRAWLREKLDASGSAGDVARRHTLYFKQLLEAAESSWDSLAPSEARRTIGRHIDNVRAALDWTFGAGHAPEIGIPLTIAAAPLWIAMFLFEECRLLVERALAALAEAPNGDPRQEMRLVAMLGIMTQHTIGIGQKLEYPWSRTLELAQSLGDVDYQLRALRGLTNGTMARDHRVALEYARRYRAVAEASSNPNAVLIGDRMLGFVLHHLGEQAEARRLTEGMLARYPNRPGRRGPADGTPDPRSVAQIIHARIAWLQGSPDQAMRIANDAVAEAVALEHPVSLFSVIAYAACPIALLEGDLGRAGGALDILRGMIRQHRPFGRWSEGFAALEVIRQGDAAAGLAMLNEAMLAVRDDPYAANFASFVAGRIEGLRDRALPDDALAAADAALARCRAANEYWYMPEFLRLRGEILLMAGRPEGVAEAERVFAAALEHARTQTALAWELRIATSVAMMKQRQGLIAAARETLAPVLGRFSEGFDTADLIAARALLASLEAPG